MGKEKEKKKASGRTLREFSSGGVVYKKLKNNYLWLVLHSTPSKSYPLDVWRLPKGWIDDSSDGKFPGPISSGKIKAGEDDLQKTAIREVAEEGGVKAKIVSKIGSEFFFFKSKLRKEKVLKFVTFYLMQWVNDLSEGHDFETSEIKWLSYEDARKQLTFSKEKKVLDNAVSILNSAIQESLI